MTKPTRIQPGSTVAVASPSSGAAAKFPHLYEAGVRVLESFLELQVVELPHTRADNATLHANPRLRADDLNQAFRDPKIAAIVTSAGGNDSVRVLPHIDTDAVLANPKPIIGLSDSTTFLAYFASLGMVTLYGPSLMVGLAQMPDLPVEFRQHVQEMLFQDTTGYEYEPYPAWSEGYPEWSDPANAGRVQPLRVNSDRWHWLQGNSAVTGRCWGGCIEVLEFLKGTRFWPGRELWSGAVLLFETSEEKPSVNQVKYMLRNYGMQGILGEAGAILFGRPRGYTPQQKAALESMILDVVAGEFGRWDMPIVTNLDFGHTDPQLIFPLGGEIEIDPTAKRIRLVQSALA